MCKGDIENPNNNFELLKLRMQRGDNLLVDRPIEFYMEFDNRHNCKSFIRTMYSKGFLRLKSSYNHEVGIWKVVLWKSGQLTYEEIEKVTEEVKMEIETFHGSYKGWTSIIIDNK